MKWTYLTYITLTLLVSPLPSCAFLKPTFKSECKKLLITVSNETSACAEVLKDVGDDILLKASQMGRNSNRKLQRILTSKTKACDKKKEIYDAYCRHQTSTLPDELQTYLPTTSGPLLPCKRGKEGEPGVTCVKGKCVTKKAMRAYLLKLNKEIVPDQGTGIEFRYDALKLVSDLVSSTDKLPKSSKVCQCDKGIDGEHCTRDCTSGGILHDAYCIRNCGNCFGESKNLTCNVKTGKCKKCNGIYKMPYCKTLKTCKKMKTCFNGTCKNSTYCKCYPGFQGNSCEEACPDDWYGSHCVDRCPVNCIDQACHRIYGTCTRGCKEGFSGDKCENEPEISANVLFGLLYDHTANQTDADVQEANVDLLNSIMRSEVSSQSGTFQISEEGQAILQNLAMKWLGKPLRVINELPGDEETEAPNDNDAAASSDESPSEGETEEFDDVGAATDATRRRRNNVRISDKDVQAYRALVLMYYGVCQSAARGFQTSKPITTFGNNARNNKCFRDMDMKFTPKRRKREVKTHVRFERQPADTGFTTEFNLRFPAGSVDVTSLEENLVSAVKVASEGFDAPGIGVDTDSIKARLVSYPKNQVAHSSTSNVMLGVVFGGVGLIVLMILSVVIKAKSNKKHNKARLRVRSQAYSSNG